MTKVDGKAMIHHVLAKDTFHISMYCFVVCRGQESQADCIADSLKCCAIGHDTLFRVGTARSTSA